MKHLFASIELTFILRMSDFRTTEELNLLFVKVVSIASYIFNQEIFYLGFYKNENEKNNNKKKQHSSFAEQVTRIINRN